MADDIRKLTEEEEKQAKGLCYPDALNFARAYASIHGSENLLVVHGSLLPPQGVSVVDGGEKIYNIRFDHAWVEVGDTVFDPASNAKNPTKPFEKIIYYKLFRVDEAEMKKYSVEEGWENYLKTGHCGPWD
jgi:hypothetical protein